MQVEIEQSEGRFKRSLGLINRGWMLVSLCTLIFAAIGVFSDHPEYLHDWHGWLIFALMVLILGLFAQILFNGGKNKPARQAWPPALTFSIPYWLGIYIPVTLLSMIDNNFVWAYFIVMGMTFSLFTSI